jgi:hypothetical protein
VRKSIAVAREVRLQIQADLFNALNQTNLRYNTQTLNVSSGGLGSLNAVSPPRNVQLGVRVTF